LFQKAAISPDHQRLNTGSELFCRGGDTAEPADHCASDQEIYFTSGRTRTLLLQHFEIVTVIRFAPLRVALLKSFGHLFANRAAPGSISIFPGQTVVLSRHADNLLRILIYFGIVMFLLRILLLRIIEPATDRDCVQFIRADTTV